MDTKNLIKKTFLDLLEQRPLSQITVKDIVSSCGINRNSFYYHYADLPALVEDVITEEADKIMEKYDSFESLEKCLDAVIEFSLSHRKVALHLFNSNSQDVFVHYFMQISDEVIRRYLEELCRDRKINEEDKEIVIHYYKCLLFGQAVDWMRCGMTNDIQHQFRRFCEFNKGSIEAMVDRLSS
jgi:AcrR family transcriptional regulator